MRVFADGSTGRNDWLGGALPLYFRLTGQELSLWQSAVMAMFMFSMAGVPVFVGFFAKWLVIKAALDAGLVWLAILAVVFSVVGAFYYLRVVKLMYFDEPETTEPIEAPIDFRAVLSANGLAQLLLGLFPGALIGLCMTSFGA